MEPNLSIRVKLPNGAEVELRGDQATIDRTLNDLQNVVSKVQTAFESTAAQRFPSKDSEDQTNKEYPVIERPSGSQDGILRVLRTSWGKTKPRNWREINDALKHNAVHLSEGSVSGALTLMVQAGKLRRVRSEGSYAYTLPLNSN
jgi:hypothetical protein